MNAERRRLQDGIAALGLDLPQQAVDALLVYVELLDRWNKTYNLTAIRTPDRMIGYHVLDSLAALPWVDHAVAGQSAPRVLDVGSGGGLPGVPWAIARPGWDITLVDSSQKKTAFLQQAAIQLQLAQVAICCRRVEQMTARASFNIITARAFADLNDFVGLTRRLLAKEGRWFALKGAAFQTEVTALPSAIEVVAIHRLLVPGVVGERHVLELKEREELGQ